MSEGEELMQAYMSMRNGATSQSSTHPALQSGIGSLGMGYGAGPSTLQLLNNQRAGSMKRDVSMSLDGDDNMSEIVPRKRQKQMVWDTSLGFISKEDLRGRRKFIEAERNDIYYS
jgi:hypothetical protein